MRTDRTENGRICVYDLKQFRQTPNTGRDRHHLGNARRMGARDDVVALRIKIGKVQMAMGIDQHAVLHASGAT